ncbi:MAG: NUDIX hydrolase [Roseiflexaceae bacterium]|jgi:8-oxo-dGTP pyrophosphatase MutT (NUDIX family)
MTSYWNSIIQQISQHNQGITLDDLPIVRHIDGRPARVNHPAAGVTPRLAAVLIVLTPYAQDIQVLLTRRGGGLREHSGEIAFPGGRQEPGETSITTALREAYEELAIPESAVTVMGALHTIYVPRSNHLVTPVVAWCDELPQLTPNDVEVAEYFTADFPPLLQPDAMQYETRHMLGDTFVVPYYPINQHRVWGATALMLSDLILRTRRLLMHQSSTQGASNEQ